MPVRPRASTSWVSCSTEASAPGISSVGSGYGVGVVSQYTLLAFDVALGAESAASVSLSVPALSFLPKNKSLLGFKASTGFTISVVCVACDELIEDIVFGLIIYSAAMAAVVAEILPKYPCFV